jgi:hypothetical protein
MIQRIQSVWLLLAAVCVFLTYKLPFYTGTNAKGLVQYSLTGTENFLLMLTTFLTGALAVLILFLYKKRTLQLRLCVLGILLEAVLIFLYYREVQTFTSGTYALWTILHTMAVLCFVLAAKGINKDEKILKESDRLR